MCLRWLLHQEGRPEIDWTTKYIVFSKFESPAKVREWKRERESDLIERIPHTWPSSHENCFHSTLGSVSYYVVFLRTPPYWSVRVVSCNFKLDGSRTSSDMTCKLGITFADESKDFYVEKSGQSSCRRAKRFWLVDVRRRKRLQLAGNC